VAKKPTSIMLTVVRCGETAWTREGRFQGATDLPLCDEGRGAVTAEAATLGAAKLGVVHHPPDEAATETARILAGPRGRHRAVPDLADPSLGLLEGLLDRDVAERYARRFRQWQDDPLALVPPDGEPIAAAQARIFRAFGRILARTRAGEATIVLHPIGFALLGCRLGDAPPSGLDKRVSQWPRTIRAVVGRDLAGRLEAPDTAPTGQPPRAGSTIRMRGLAGSS
jgi:probable phosphoglycerate mutase